SRTQGGEKGSTRAKASKSPRPATQSRGRGDLGVRGRGWDCCYAQPTLNRETTVGLKAKKLHAHNRHCFKCDPGSQGSETHLSRVHVVPRMRGVCDAHYL